jgi:hypothetical protein
VVQKTVEIFVFLTLGFIFSVPLKAQLYYRIEADFSIKEKSSSGYENLMLGRVYFDKNVRQSVFDVKFPEKEILIINDTATIKAIERTYTKHVLGRNLLDFSVLNLFIQGNLDYFGLNNTPFELDKVEQDQGLVISTWVLKNKYVGSPISKLLLSQKDNKLNGLITFDNEGNIISKQIFSDYILVEKIAFPSRVLQISFFPDGTELKKITEYSNIIVNSKENESLYNYKYNPGPK